MLYALLKTVHVLCVIVWIGGMAFAQFFLRPALELLPPPQRLQLMHEVLRRFFAAALGLGLLILVTGLGLMLASGLGRLPLAWLVMAGLGTVMLAVLLHLRFVRFAKFAQAVLSADWPLARGHLAGIRRWVAINLGLGGLIVVVVLLGQGL